MMKLRTTSLPAMPVILLLATSAAAPAYSSLRIADDHQPNSSLNTPRDDGVRIIPAQRRGLGPGYGAPPVLPPTVQPPPDRPPPVYRLVPAYRPFPVQPRPA